MPGRRKTKRAVNPLILMCPVCFAEPQHPCLGLDAKGRPTGRLRKYVHPRREVEVRHFFDSFVLHRISSSLSGVGSAVPVELVLNRRELTALMETLVHYVGFHVTPEDSALFGRIRWKLSVQLTQLDIIEKGSKK